MLYKTPPRKQKKKQKQKNTISQINAMMNKKLKTNISQTCFDK